MTALKIKNIGPLREVFLELKRFNFFIGRQSSGKSTIAKIISFCTWVEKDIQTHPNLQNNIKSHESLFIKELEDFHCMHGYFRDDSFLEYISDYVTIKFENQKCSIKISAKKTYERIKVLYIPAERMIAAWNNMEVNTKQMAVKDFLVDFDSARDFYPYKKRIELADLGITYYQEKNSDGKPINKVTSSFEGSAYDIELDDASSGLQSMTPIVVSVDFYSGRFYHKNVESITLSVAQERDRKEVKNYLQKNSNDPKAAELRIERLLESKRTNFVVEEPELNLFPTTQRNLLNFLVACCNKRRKHSLTITTHSPYIINQLNLLLKAYDKDKKIDNASINFDELNVYIVQNGTIQDLKIKNEGVHIINTENLSDDINDIYDIYEKL